jgi:hypothetical protein
MAKYRVFLRAVEAKVYEVDDCEDEDDAKCDASNIYYDEIDAIKLIEKVERI